MKVYNSYLKYFINVILKLYFYIFYNTNFIINFIISLNILLPFLLFMIFINSYKSAYLVYALAISFINSFLYIIVYVINDIVDYAKDKQLKIYKVSVLSLFNFRNYMLIYFLYLALLFTYLIQFNQQVILISVIYIIILIIVSTAHSKNLSSKIFTIFILRFLRFVLPGILFYTFTQEIIMLYFILISIFVFPIYLHKNLQEYILLKLTHIRFNKYKLIYLIYFILFLISILQLENYLNLINLQTFIVIALLYSAILFSKEFLSQIIYMLINFDFLYKTYGSNYYNQGRLLVSGVINIIICLILYFKYV